jgi:glucose-6-phosphate isomerase
MARLGTEQDIPMLDWVDAVPRLLADRAQLEEIEAEARQLLARGVRHVIWAGMGGSVLAVQVLRALGFCGSEPTIHPLDSTDPAALNALLRDLAAAKGFLLPALDAHEPDTDVLCRSLLGDTLMIAVAMGMTSEEPISHLTWFGDLLVRAGLAPATHQLVMALPDSYLDRYAREHAIPTRPLQPDGGSGTGGRMSAPSTRIFLLPVALDLAARDAPAGSLRRILARAWQAYDLDGAMATPGQHPYVRLAAALAGASDRGACHLFLRLPPQLEPLSWWTEQLMEESLGKGGKGVIVFSDQPVGPRPAPAASPCGLSLRLTAEAEAAPAGAPAEGFHIREPLLGAPDLDDQLAGIAATFLGLQLTMALFGYLHDVAFAGQPAVEHYKSRARALRLQGDPLAAVRGGAGVTQGRLTLLPPPGVQLAASPAETLAGALTASLARLTYLDLTVNGELGDGWSDALERHLRRLGNEHLGVPVKLRRAPAAYHSTEQSEMDGPEGIISVRALALRSETCLLGDYDAAFLRAQAVGTWQAMNEAARPCFLLLYDGTGAALGPALDNFLEEVVEALSAGQTSYRREPAP